MTRETAKKNLEIIKAYAEGKKIQMLSDSGTWEINDNPLFMDNCEYRIKPVKLDIEYVPWTVENCPLKCGDIILYKNNNNIQVLVTGTDFSEEVRERALVNGNWLSFKEILEDYVMTDGTPCGEKVDDCPVADDNDKE